MVDQARANLDAAGVNEAIKAALSDAGYYSEQNAKDLEQRGIEAYLATETVEASREGGVCGSLGVGFPTDSRRSSGWPAS